MTTEHYSSIAPGEDGHIAAMCGCTLVRDEDTGIVRLYLCPMHDAADTTLLALKELADMRDGYHCDSCGCEVADLGYCGCLPLRDAVVNDRRCRARVAVRRAMGAASPTVGRAGADAGARDPQGASVPVGPKKRRTP